MDRHLAVGLERGLAEVDTGCNDLEDGHLHDLADVEELHGLDEHLELLRLVHGLDLDAAGLAGVVVVLGALEEEGVLHRLLGALGELVEDVVVPLALGLRDDPRLLKQVLGDLGAANVAVGVELDLDELAEAGRVVVAASLGVTESLQHRDGLQHHVLDVRLTVRTRSEELQDELGRLGLSGTGLSADQHGLVLASLAHLVVRLLGDGEDVRGKKSQALALVVLHPATAVDGEPLEGVDSNQNGASVGVDELVLVTLLEVSEHTVQVHILHLSHVLIANLLEGSDLLRLRPLLLLLLLVGLLADLRSVQVHAGSTLVAHDCSFWEGSGWRSWK
mmetsp:Transcript_21266/g.82528  ORF Transcript_21266/g.82528 Transcript_21266/m.82528 type:complete len:333 (+) Transcript_21266:994-1992(+)